MTATAGAGARRPGLIDQVALELRSRIVSGQWPVGSRIPPEPDLVRMTGVGRNTVREAVQSLVHSGMLERKQGSGTYVISTSELATVMTRQFAQARQRDVLEVRMALEVRTAALAALRRTADDVADLQALAVERRKAVESGHLDRMVDVDLELHRRIAQCSGNPVLTELYETLLDAVMENIRFNFSYLAHTADDHSALIDAIAAGDADAAYREIELYLTEQLRALPGEDAEGGDDGAEGPTSPDGARPVAAAGGGSPQ